MHDLGASMNVTSAADACIHVHQFMMTFSAGLMTSAVLGDPRLYQSVKRWKA